MADDSTPFDPHESDEPTELEIAETILAMQITFERRLSAFRSVGFHYLEGLGVFKTQENGDLRLVKAYDPIFGLEKSNIKNRERSGE